MNGVKLYRLWFLNKVGRVFPTVIRSKFCLRKYRDDDYRKDAPRFNKNNFMLNKMPKLFIATCSISAVKVLQFLFSKRSF